MIKVERVLIPVDGSDSSRNAAKYGTQLVNSRHPKIYLLNVWEPVTMTIGGDMAEKLRANAEARSMAILEEYKKMLEPCGMEVELISRSGRPDYVILNVQDELDCDLIVIGSRGLSVLENVIMGSVVTRVLEGANCPVLVTRNLRVKYLRDACGI
ncbi:Nucleotide-binding universal stress protein, UspA family [Desulfomicrobium apsheronum]|uniref:Nucleotide-binding universal stress protein, UspA family n=2 Tax=Desulfomicrobium TaxID=898 RepID=A0A1I3XG50_9BACT|nr:MULTISPECIES: universal stress protein [Desulfomicrobium]MBE1425179.1 nucleotide-binding universal stress UspA family protein [Desulfomicrobium macestii]SFK18503.1 Nucleotide-binding universal stress protein, UspA family [Desulfomicrobium apsheronum]